ncbi:hypothetical protein INT45_011837 [Circinella minor]|uniref:E3 ubiquitin-protein ligase n=1 Tax=Circinella minor TaxID=1195481 RepID=A0A8H7RVV0_9FUNG|nr:hypothetical protein INT45_011837 [Circinella minor]
MSKRRLSSVDDQQQQQQQLEQENSTMPLTIDPSSTPYASYDLATFLWQTPFIFDYTFDDAAKRAVLEKCYATLWKNKNQTMRQYFFSNRHEFKESIDRSLLHRHRRARNNDGMTADDLTNAQAPTQQEDADMDNSNNNSDQHTHKRHHLERCGRVFRKGEPVYRCRNCGLDDTCVLCSKCFHSSNHENHTVFVSISPGSGGCCDCGDPEAWKVPLDCSIHSSRTSYSPGQRAASTKAMTKHVRKCLTTILDFILCVFSLASEEISLPQSNDEIIQWNRNECVIFRRMKVPARTGLQKKRKQRAQQQQSVDDMDMDKENQEDATKQQPVDDDLLYSLIAWNDETHSLKDVCESVVRALSCDYEHARRIVETIQMQGREKLGTSTNLDELRSMAAPLTNIGFGVTIKPARDVFREQVCAVLIDWLQELARTPFPLNENGTIRTILCEEFCVCWELPRPLAVLTTGSPPVRLLSEDDELEDEEEQGEEIENVEDDLDDYHLETNGDDTVMNGSGFEQRQQASSSSSTTTTSMRQQQGEQLEEDIEMDEPDEATDVVVPVIEHINPDNYPIIYQNQNDIASIEWDPAPMVKDHRRLAQEEQNFAAALDIPRQQIHVREMNETRALALAVQREFEKKRRLDYFLLYDLRVWKEVRISLRELYIMTLGSNPVFKKRFGKRLVRNYARLADAFLFRDREPESAIILFSVQLLTVPSVCSLLVNEYYFFGLICSTLAAFFTTDQIYYLPPNERADLPTRLSCESKAFRTRRYFNAFHDLRYILNVDLLKPLLAQDPVYLRHYLDLVSLFQAMNPQLCQKDTHVEYESEIWVNAFNVTLQIAKCCRAFSDCYNTLPKDTPERQVQTAQTLVRAVARILKAIDSWGVGPIEEGTMVPATTSVKFHTVTLPYLGDMEVIKYDISSEPVSFHHPLHWLLAGVLEAASWLTDHVLEQAGWTSGFTNAITLFNSADKNLLPRILDFPIRTLAFSSQIRAGVWVRNGYNIRNQVHHYRDISLREATYDSDIFLLQFAFVSIEPNYVLATLMDRFDLTSWFTGATEHTQYDNMQCTFMVEEILYLLILCVSERANATHKSVQDKIRREIVHHLCLGSTVYSELVKRIPERLTEHPDFDEILNQVANFKAPVSLNDSGRYELREEYFDMVDPYFWHYSRNNRGEAELVLKNRWKKENPDKDESTFFVLPKPFEEWEQQGDGDGPFKKLERFLGSPVIVQMITYTMYNIRRLRESHKSDTILDEALYLILLAMTVQDPSEFCQYAVGRMFTFESTPDDDASEQEMSLFQVLDQYRHDEHYKDTHARIDWIFEQMKSRGGDIARPIVNQYFESLQQQKNQQEGTSSDVNNQELSEQEKKKQAAKERQQKIMAMFAQAQSAFMEQNEDLYDEDEEEDIDGSQQRNGSADLDNNAEGNDSENATTMTQRVCAYPTGTCIVCQEDVNERSLPYGMLVYVQISNILREAEMNNGETFKNMANMGPSLDLDWPDTQIPNDDDPKRQTCGHFPSDRHKSGLCSTTCGHLMHMKCFDAYCASIEQRHTAQLTRNHPENRLRKEFTCPLCKSLGNVLMPILWKGKAESYPGVLANADEEAYNHFLQADIHLIAEKLQYAINPSQPPGYGIWSAGGDTLFAPRLPSLRGDNSGSGDKIPGFSSLLGLAANEQHQQRLNRLGPPDMLYRSAVGVIPAISSAYTRLFDVLSAILDICGIEATRSLSNSIKNVDTLWGVLGYTIASVEISTRGGTSSPSTSKAPTTLFAQIPSQAQMLLRILSDTVISYTSLMCQSDPPHSGSRLFNIPPVTHDSSIMVQVHTVAVQRMLQIFASDTVTTTNQQAAAAPDTRLYDNAPLLLDDPFMILSELSVHLVQVTKTDIYPFVRVLLLAELAKAAVGLLQENHLPMYQTSVVSNNDTKNDDGSNSDDALAAKEFGAFVANKINSEQSVIINYRFDQLLKSFALPFLRRTLILLISRFGLIVDEEVHEHQQDDIQEKLQEHEIRDSEFDRLLRVLHLPKLSILLRHQDTEQIVTGWCNQLVKESERRGEPQRVTLDLPTPLSLIRLPKRLDTLMDESMRRVCPRCQTVPTDPAVCLLCGTFVCAQSFCCSEGEEGECNLHMLECGGEIGLYLLIKRCSLLVLHNENGWFMQAPYLDAHGEVDEGLRRGRPQYLAVKRYADTRKLWLQHGIPAYVARQIEASYDVGGWTTL